MVPTPQSHAEIDQVCTGSDQAQRIGHIQDELARRSHPAGALTPVCFTALSASATRSADGAVLTFATHTGKSLQILLQLPSEKTSAFHLDLMGLLRVRKPYAHYSQ